MTLIIILAGIVAMSQTDLEQKYVGKSNVCLSSSLSREHCGIRLDKSQNNRYRCYAYRHQLLPERKSLTNPPIEN
jgi:hypothetical protein